MKYIFIDRYEYFRRIQNYRDETNKIKSKAAVIYSRFPERI